MEKKILPMDIQFLSQKKDKNFYQEIDKNIYQ